MKIAILIPSTTNQRDWNCITQTYLYKSIISFVGKYNPDYQYKFYIGIDTDDKIYSVQSHKNKIYELCRELNVLFIRRALKRRMITSGLLETTLYTTVLAGWIIVLMLLKKQKESEPQDVSTVMEEF